MTHRLTDEEFALATRTEAPPKLSRVPPGHWRCVFAIPPEHNCFVSTLPHVWKHFVADEWLWVEEAFQTEAAADVRAMDILANAAACGVDGFAYRRAEFFPDYSGSRA